MNPSDLAFKVINSDLGFVLLARSQFLRTQTLRISPSRDLEEKHQRPTEVPAKVIFLDELILLAVAADYYASGIVNIVRRPGSVSPHFFPEFWYKNQNAKHFLQLFRIPPVTDDSLCLVLTVSSYCHFLPA